MLTDEEAYMLVEERERRRDAFVLWLLLACLIAAILW